jgi:hypothetical protein
MVSLNMRIVAVEEHFTCPDLLGRIDTVSAYRCRRQLSGSDFYKSTVYK